MLYAVSGSSDYQPFFKGIALQSVAANINRELLLRPSLFHST